MSSKPYQLLFLTERSPHHQQAALEMAPPEVAVTMLRVRDRATILTLLPQMDFLISERASVIDAEKIAVGRRLQLIQRLGLLIHFIRNTIARLPLTSMLPLFGLLIIPG